jgi:hypothetical protein
MREVNNLPININEALEKELQSIKERLSSSPGAKVRNKGNTCFILPDGVEVEEITAVIVDFVTVNSYFDRVYSDRDDSPKVPACYAVGFETGQMAPAEGVPVKQSESCKTCPQNQFGSAPNGKAKACKNMRVLALMPVTSDMANAPIYTLSVPPGSLSYFDKYVNNLASRAKRTPISVVTRISLDKNTAYFSPRFDVEAPLEEGDIAGYFSFREEARKILTTLPDFAGYEAPPKRGR